MHLKQEPTIITWWSDEFGFSKPGTDRYSNPTQYIWYLNLVVPNLNR
eukprot:SAG11_NODE_37383_length_257_cov_0.651899_1_plen_46_part_10